MHAAVSIKGRGRRDRRAAAPTQRRAPHLAHDRQAAQADAGDADGRLGHGAAASGGEKGTRQPASQKGRDRRRAAWRRGAARSGARSRLHGAHTCQP